MKEKEKEKARILRNQGKSLNQIVQETGFSKASVSLWVRDIVLTHKQRQNISTKGRTIAAIENRRLSRLANEQTKRRLIIDEAKKAIGSLSQKDLLLIGSTLYLGEGGKTYKGMARIANSDPVVIQIVMRFFREICKVPEERFRGHIHTFSHADIVETERYWSGITGIPTKQFFKTYAKQSSASLGKRNTLRYGTMDVVVCDTKLFLTIMGWIEKIKELAV